MDDFTRDHLRNWWEQYTFDDQEPEYETFVAFVTEDLEYWSANGWASAWRSYLAQLDAMEAGR